MRKCGMISSFYKMRYLYAVQKTPFVWYFHSLSSKINLCTQISYKINQSTKRLAFRVKYTCSYYGVYLGRKTLGIFNVFHRCLVLCDKYVVQYWYRSFLYWMTQFFVHVHCLPGRFISYWFVCSVRPVLHRADFRISAIYLCNNNDLVPKLFETRLIRNILQTF